MNLNQLHYFVALAHVEHYTKAAQELSISQPSLSHAIASLEKELGIHLFERNGRNVCLTKYGKVFLKYVEGSLKNLEEGIKTVQDMTCQSRGKIDIGYIYTQGLEFVPGAVGAFKKENPENQIDYGFYSGMTEEVLQGLKDEKYDVVFCSMKDGEGSIEFCPVSEEKLAVAVPKGHPLSGKNEITISEVAQYEQIFFHRGSGLRRVLDNLFATHKIKPKIAYEVDEDTAMIGLVSQGFGIGIVPDVATVKNVNVELIPLSGVEYCRYIYMATVKNRFQSPAVKKFVEFVKENYCL